MDISGNVDAFMISYRPDSRHTSFDYCFNYFQSYRDSNEIRKLAEDNMELSYLQIGFYLASWGMFRSGLLRTRSSKQFEPLVQLIAETPKEFWDIDMGGYDDATCEQLVEQSRRIIRVLSEPLEDTRYPTKTVATKVMLGVFGNVPAFDRYVRKGLSCQLGVSVFGVRAMPFN